MELFPDVLSLRGIEGSRFADSSIMLALKRMTAVVLIAVAMLLGSVGVGADANGQELSASDVKQIFANLEASIENDPGRGSYTWYVKFSPKGIWDAENEYGKDAWGRWNTDGSKICIETKGGNQGLPSIYEGCIKISVDMGTGEIKGNYLEAGIANSFIGQLERTSNFMQQHIAARAEKARKLKIALRQKEDKRKKLLEEETKLRILSVQRSLRTLGVYQGEVNGVLSSNLLSSLTQWGKGSGFLFKGDITPALVSILELTAEDEKVAKAKALEKKKKEEIARKKAEKKRKAKLARKKKAEKKRKAELARKKEMEKKRKAELARKKEVEKKRKAELARKKEVEKKRKAELARIKEEKKRNIELYEENIGKANYTIEVVRKFLKENPRTSVLADASIALLGVRKSIKEKNGQELVKKITILNNTLNKDRQYKKYVSKVTALKLTNLKKVLSTYNLVFRDVLLERIEAGSENVEQVAANIKIVSEGLNSKKLSEVINNVKTVESFINADKEMTVKLKLARKKAEDAHKAKLAREEADKQRKAKLASQKAEKALKEKLAREEADKQRKAELARRKAEESRREELARKEHEEKRKAEQALKAQKAEVAREAELAKQEKIRRIAEQARIDAEKQRAERLALKKAEDARIAEETRLAELARKKAEEARLKEQARREAAEALALKKRNEQRKLYKNKILFKIAEKNNMVKLLDHNSETSSLVIGCSYNLQINNYTGSDISVKRLQLHSSLRGVSNLGSAGSWISINKKIGNDGVETDIPPILLGKRIEVLKKLDEDSKEIKQYKDKYACEKQDGTISIKYKKPATFLKIANKKRLSRKTLSRILVGTDVSGNQIKIVQQ